jgi:hypothetical protein
MTFEEAQEKEKKDYCIADFPPPISIDEIIKQQWIRIKDRLPSSYEVAIVYCPKDVLKIRICQLQIWEDAIMLEITHWMKLPPPPKEE